MEGDIILLTKEAKDKSKFRQSSKWKNWRKYLKGKRKVDEITNKPLYKGWQCHHLDMSSEHYTELYEDKFICVNRKTHDVIHWLFRYTNWKEVLYNLSKIMTEMEKYNER